MNKIYYNQEGWVCERYPYDIPIEDETRFIEVDEDIYSNTLSCPSYKAWKVVKDQLIIEDYEAMPVDEKLQLELQEIRRWLKNNDWIPNKIITGEWEETDPRWIDYLSERADKRERQDELTFLLGID
jgi:hypothetical protein